MLFQSPKPMYIGPEGAAEARARSPRRRLSNSGSSASGSSSSLCATSPVHSPNPTPVRLDEPVAKAETRRPHPFLDPSTKTKASARPKSPGARGGKSAPKRADGHGPPSSKGVGRVSPNPVKLINQKGEPVAGVAPRVQGTAPSLSTSRRYEPPALDRDWGPLRFPLLRRVASSRMCPRSVALREKGEGTREREMIEIGRQIGWFRLTARRCCCGHLATRRATVRSGRGSDRQEAQTTSA